MTLAKYFIPTFFLVALISCDSDPLYMVNQFNYSKGNQYKYVYTENIIHTDTIVTRELGEYKLEVVSTTSKVEGYNDLIEFKIYKTDTPGFYANSWYRQTDNCLYDIAYKNARASLEIQPKALTNNSPEFLHFLLPYLQDVPFTNEVVDTLIIRDDIRLALPLPLSLESKKWTEFTSPFLRTSRVLGVKSFEINGKTETTLEIYSEIYPGLDTERTDLSIYSYFNSKGLIKRTLILTNQQLLDEVGSIVDYVDITYEIALREE